MPKPKLAPLKLRVADAQKELDATLGAIEGKRPILDKLLEDIKTAEKKLDDNFSHEQLELQKASETSKTLYEAEERELLKKIADLKDLYQKQFDSYSAMQAQASKLKDSILNSDRVLRNNQQETERLKTTVIGLRTDESRLINSIDSLKSQRQNLENEISVKVAENNTAIYDMNTEFTGQRNVLDEQISTLKSKLRELQQTIQLHENKRTEQEEDWKKRENDLIDRENSIIIKNRAFAKERAEFDTEIRRWNYVKPTPHS